MSANALGSVPRADKHYPRESSFSGAESERVLASFSLALIKLTQSNQEEILFDFCVPITFYRGGRSGQGLKQEQRQDPWRKVAYWLAALTCSGTNVQGWPCPQCAGPSHISQQSKQCPQICSMGLPDGGSSSVETPSSQVGQVGVKLSKTKS